MIAPLGCLFQIFSLCAASYAIRSSGNLKAMRVMILFSSGLRGSASDSSALNVLNEVLVVIELRPVGESGIGGPRQAFSCFPVCYHVCIPQVLCCEQHLIIFLENMFTKNGLKLFWHLILSWGLKMSDFRCSCLRRSDLQEQS